MPVICFGETLWDHVGAERYLGGAPLNVAYHLARLGVDVRLASAVGDDEAGRTALAQMHRAGIDTRGVRRHPVLPTGMAGVTLSADGEPTFRIAEPVAWDEIAEAPALFAQTLTAGTSGAGVVFGTLALRRTPNRLALAALLDHCAGSFVACDVNLRAPYDSIEALDHLMRRAHLLKLNAAEAARLVDSSVRDARTLAERVRERFGARYVCVTLGPDGAGLLDGDQWHHRAAPSVAVVDAVGAGDAFMAALVASIVETGPMLDWDDALDRACALGGCVAAQRGAQPEYDPAPFRPVFQLRKDS